MTSLAAAASTHGGSDESAEHEAARRAGEPGVDAWIEKRFGNDEPAE